MKEKIVQLILNSKIFDDRQKWGMIDYVKKNDVSENDLKAMIGIFERGEENIFIEKEKKQVFHKDIIKKIIEREKDSLKQDEIEKRELLKELDNIE